MGRRRGRGRKKGGRNGFDEHQEIKTREAQNHTNHGRTTPTYLPNRMICPEGGFTL
jgi:hypothetical protein